MKIRDIYIQSTLRVHDVLETKYIKPFDRLCDPNLKKSTKYNIIQNMYYVNINIQDMRKT